MVCRGVLQPEKLPPTERAAHYHGLRVHLQVIEWTMLDETSNLDPKEWGWKSADGYLTPITTDKEIAPTELLKVIRCNCKTSSKNQCGTNICTCRKHGLKCMPACGGCHGESCNNKAVRYIFLIYFLSDRISENLNGISLSTTIIYV